MQRAASGRCTRIRAKISGAVYGRATHQFKTRPFVRNGQPQRQVALVVAQLDVVLRAMLLDEAVFENGRFFFRGGKNGLEVTDVLSQPGHVGPFIGRVRSKVAAHA